MARREPTTGELTRRVTIERPSAAEDRGEIAEHWRPLATVWAKVEPLSGRDYDYAAQVRGEITHRVSIRWRRDVQAGDRFVLDGRILRLIAPPRNLGERQVWLECDCAEQS